MASLFIATILSSQPTLVPDLKHGYFLLLLQSLADCELSLFPYIIFINYMCEKRVLIKSVISNEIMRIKIRQMLPYRVEIFVVLVKMYPLCISFVLI